MIKISIIVPIYNKEKYLIKCIDSIINQTFSDFELILIDDGSSDWSPRICDQYSKIDKRITIIHKENGGISDARNVGLKLAKADYVGFVDPDDYIEKDMYEKLFFACIKYKSDISMCGRYDIYKNAKNTRFSFKWLKLWSAKEAIKNLLQWNNIDSALWDKIFKRELFEDILFPVWKYHEDIFVLVKILSKTNKVAHIGESKYYYCHRINSITSETFSLRRMALLEAAKEVSDFIAIKYPELNKEWKGFYYNNAIYLLSMLQNKILQQKYSSSFKLLKTILLEKMITIFLSKEIGLKNKIIFLLLITNTYNFTRDIIINTTWKKQKLE